MSTVKWAVGVAGAAGLIAGCVLAVPSGAGAATGEPMVLGQTNFSDAETTIFNTGKYGVGLSVIKGLRSDTLSVIGAPGIDTAVFSSQSGHRAITAYAYDTPATVFAENSGGGPAFYGSTTSDSGTALLGLAGSKGRGARLRGGAAQLYLEPGTAASHPSSGQLGDLYLDRAGRLWFCKGGTSWKQLA
jgi:hypothetical protein